MRFFSTYGRAHPEKGKKFLLGKIEYVCSIMYMSLGVVGGAHYRAYCLPFGSRAMLGATIYLGHPSLGRGG